MIFHEERFLDYEEVDANNETHSNPHHIPSSIDWFSNIMAHHWMKVKLILLKNSFKDVAAWTQDGWKFVIMFRWIYSVDGCC